MEVLRTAEERFAQLEGWPYAPRYVDVDGLRMHYVDVGPREADPVLLVHGEPTWGYLYRTVVETLVAAGQRCVVPDLIGFGRSDKPADTADYSYDRHLAWLGRLIGQLDLRGVTLVGQDWGGLLGLRLVVDEDGEFIDDAGRFARVVAANTGLPTGDEGMPDVWHGFRDMVARATTLDIGRLVASGVVKPLGDAARAAYDAPFPDEEYKAGARAFPELVPHHPDHPASEANRRAWARLERLQTPLLCVFGDSDPITAPAERPLRERIPGARGQPHTRITGAGHFVQEDAGVQLGEVIARFCG